MPFNLVAYVARICTTRDRRETRAKVVHKNVSHGFKLVQGLKVKKITKLQVIYNFMEIICFHTNKISFKIDP